MMMKNEQEEQRIGIDEEIHEERYEQRRKNVFLPYDELRIIFRYLNAMDLSSAAMVCRSWLKAANDEKFLRGPHCFRGHCISTAGEYNFDCIKQLKIKPFVGFFFLHFLIRHDNVEDVQDSVCELLPTSCKTIMLFTNTIVINDKIYTLDKQSDMICAFLPQIPNVNIEIIHINVKIITELLHQLYFKKNISLPSDATREDCEIYMHSVLLSDIRVKKQNVICFIESRKAVDDGIVAMLRTNNKQLAQKNLTVSSLEHRLYGAILLITDAVKMWSIVLDDKCLTRESIENKLKTFKEQVKLQKHSLGFMFYSITRVMPDVDLRIFKELFPKFSLVGCHCYGMFEGNCIDRIDFLFQCCNEENRYKPTSTFIILTYG